MPKKETPEMLLIKLMGKDAANELLVRIDKMIAKGKSVEEIEKLVNDEIATHIEQEVSTATKIAIGPRDQNLIKPIMVPIHDLLHPNIAISKLPALKVQIGPTMK